MMKAEEERRDPELADMIQAEKEGTGAYPPLGVLVGRRLSKPSHLEHCLFDLGHRSAHFHIDDGSY